MSFIVSVFHHLKKFLYKYIKTINMNVSNEEENDSDLISTDSWTFLENSDKDAPATYPEEQKLNENLETDNGFQSVIELPEKHSNESHSKRKKRTKTKHNKLRRKSIITRSDALTFLSIFGAMLTVSGLSLILTMFPDHAIDDRSFRIVEENFMYITANKNITHQNAVRNVSKALEAIDAVKSTNLAKKLKENIPELNNVCPLSENLLSTSKTENIIKEKNASKPQVSENTFQNVNETSHNNNSVLNSFSKIFRTPKFHILLTTIIHDLFLFKAFFHLKRNKFLKKVNEENKRIFKSVSTHKKYETINNNTRKCSSQNMLLATKLKSTPIIKFQKPASELLLNKSVMNIPVDSNGSQPENLYLYAENNKLEKVDYYKEQFKKLENMWNNVGQNHRQNIQLIKEQFHKEIAEMHEKSLESSSFNMSRKEKVLLLREKYTQQLKRNRELYLTELKKIREEREKIIKKLCNNSHKIKNNQKNNEKVPINYDSPVDSCDLRKRLLLLKQQQGNLTKNNEEVCNTSAEFKNNNKSLATKLNEKRVQHNKHKQKYLKRKIKCFRGNYEDMSSLHNNNTNCRNQKGPEIDLYEALFEQNAKTIRNKDMIKWSPNKHSEQFEVIYNRSDPKNNTKKTFSYKGVL